MPAKEAPTHERSSCLRVCTLAQAGLHVCATLCANVVIAGGNQIGYDLGWRVLRAIVITPVSFNHIFPCVLSRTLPT